MTAEPGDLLALEIYSFLYFIPPNVKVGASLQCAFVT